MEPVPEVDVRFGDPASPPTPWSDVQRVLVTAELFWITTVRRDGRPHVTPLPAVWTDDCLHFCTGAAEQKAVNLVGSGDVVLTTGCNEWKNGLDIVVEGSAVRLNDDAVLRKLADLWRTKYQGEWDFAVANAMFHHGDSSALVFQVAPTKVLAFAKGQFAQTRYRFAASGPSSS